MSATARGPQRRKLPLRHIRDGSPTATQTKTPKKDMDVPNHVRPPRPMSCNSPQKNRAAQYLPGQNAKNPMGGAGEGGEEASLTV